MQERNDIILDHVLREGLLSVYLALKELEEQEDYETCAELRDFLARIERSESGVYFIGLIKSYQKAQVDAGPSVQEFINKKTFSAKQLVIKLRKQFNACQKTSQLILS